MPKYLVAVRYTAEGAQGVIREGGSSRRRAAQQVIESVGGTLECFYFAYGETDMYSIADFPDELGPARCLAGGRCVRRLGHEHDPAAHPGADGRRGRDGGHLPAAWERGSGRSVRCRRGVACRRPRSPSWARDSPDLPPASRWGSAASPCGSTSEAKTPREFGAGIYLKENSLPVLDALGVGDAIAAAGERIHTARIVDEQRRTIVVA